MGTDDCDSILTRLKSEDADRSTGLLDTLLDENAQLRNQIDRLRAECNDAADVDTEFYRLRGEIAATRKLLSAQDDETLQQAAERVSTDVNWLASALSGAYRRERPLDCAAAHPGELTYECDATKPCTPCVIRCLVEAANAWLESPAKGLGSHAEFALQDAVLAYRASKETK